MQPSKVKTQHAISAPVSKPSNDEANGITQAKASEQTTRKIMRVARLTRRVDVDYELGWT